MNWLGKRKIYYLFSLLLLTSGLVAILRGGIQPSIEFRGGSQLSIQAPSPKGDFIQRLKEISKEQLQHEIEVIEKGSGQFELSLPPVTNTQKEDLLVKFRAEDPGVTETTFQTVGPSVGKELIVKTAWAIGLALVVILGYVWLQFRDWRFGLAATSAMLHDTFILIGAYAWLGLVFGAQADVLFVTAVLTILSFSVHDTIVLFDQVRELRRRHAGASLEEIGNLATTQTLSRSINNSLTIILMLLALLILGGESLRWFTAALLTGTVVGTYSSTFVALPLLVDFRTRK